MSEKLHALKNDISAANVQRTAGTTAGPKDGWIIAVVLVALFLLGIGLWFLILFLDTERLRQKFERRRGRAMTREGGLPLETIKEEEEEV